MNSSRNSFEMMCFSRFIILQRCGYAIFICSKSCKLLDNKKYDDITFPIAFSKAVFGIIPVDWDTSDITESRDYTFTIIDNRTTLTKTRVTVNGYAGLYKALIIGI